MRRCIAAVGKMAGEAVVVITFLLLAVVALHQLSKVEDEALPPMPPSRRYAEFPAVKRRKSLCGCFERQGC